MAGGCEHPGWTMIGQRGPNVEWECTTEGCHARKVTFDGKPDPGNPVPILLAIAFAPGTIKRRR